MDNIRLKVPCYCIKDWESSSFDEVVTYGEKEKTTLKSRNEMPGLSYLAISHELTICANARIFGNDYGLGFSLDTIEKLRLILKDLGIELNPDYAGESKLSDAHEKTDLLIEPTEIFDELVYLCPSKYARTAYPNSYTFKNLNKSYNFIVNFYGKYHEMTKTNPKKYELSKTSPEPFKGVTRMETKCDGAKTVNWFYGTRNFKEILESKNNHQRIFNELIEGQPMKTKKMDLSQFKTITELNHYASAKLLFENHNGDINSIKRYLDSFYSKNTKGNSAFKNFKKMLPLITNPEGKELKHLQTLKTILAGKGIEMLSNP